MTNMGGIFFDPNMNMSKAFECSMLKVLTLPVFATNYASLELTDMQDSYDLLDLSGNRSRNNNNCSDLRSAIFSDTDQYLSWSSGISAMPRLDLNSCDIAIYGDNARCAMQVGLSYSSQLVNIAKTEPGIEKLTIWLNAGAVVGGVQFLFWFFAIFAQHQV